jgi:hypothetical protein
MNNNIENNHLYDDSYSLHSFIEYVNENYIGLLLLLFAVYIVYIVDHISYLNSLMFVMPSPIPGAQISTANILPKTSKNKKSSK